MSVKNEPLLDLGNARVEAQREKMKNLLAEGKCPFCSENLEEYHDNPIEWEHSGSYWVVTKNDYPYANTPSQHYLLIHKTHIESITDVSPNASRELFVLVDQIARRCGVTGASLLMRFGSSIFTGATVSHLHTHVICGEVKTPESKPILAVLGWKKE